MQTSQPQITIEEVAAQFNQWRKTKTSKFNPIPNNLKILIKQLLQHYPQSQIITHLKINTAIIKSIVDNDNNNNNLDQDLNFIPFQINSDPNHDNFDNHHNIDISTSGLANQNAQSTCEIIKPSGIKLIINTSDPQSIVQAFLCSS